MKTSRLRGGLSGIIAAWLAGLLLAAVPGPAVAENPVVDDPSGRVVDGVRVITLDPTRPPGDLYVFRGDEVRLVAENLRFPYSVHIPEYKISVMGETGRDLVVDFKAKDVGVFPIFCAGDCPVGDGMHFGRVIVMQYEAEAGAVYEELDAARAKAFIEKNKPLVLDVRTPREYYDGHLPDAVLIPVQQLRGRISELDQYKGKDIFVYCRSGNRSTVAAKILIDNGFNKIYNLRTGIKDWVRRGYRIVK